MSDRHQVNQPNDPIERGLCRVRELLAARGATPHEGAEAIASTPFVPPTEAEMAAIHVREERLNAMVVEYNLVSSWSCGEEVELNAPHPYPFATNMVYTTISGVEPESGVRAWGGDGGRFEAAITGSRWLDLWIAADAVIQDSGDLHHCFIEGFEADRDNRALLHLGVGS